MKILQSPATAEIIVRKSRFVAELSSVSSPEEARARWRERKENSDNGGHIVYAFSCGAQGNISGCSDDGEPAGTAGRPVLAVLQGAELTWALLLVIRYFGGIKLGTGGLVRAYGDSAKAVLAAAVLTPLVPLVSARTAVSYDCHGALLRAVAAAGFQVTGTEFGAAVTLTVSGPEASFPELQAQTAGITGGGTFQIC